MDFFCCAEEVFLIPWGIIPKLKGLRIERAHVEGNTIFIDNRKKQMLYQPANLEVWRVKCYENLRLESLIQNAANSQMVRYMIERSEKTFV